MFCVRYSPERARLRAGDDFCCALQGSILVILVGPRALPWASLFRRFEAEAWATGYAYIRTLPSTGLPPPASSTGRPSGVCSVVAGSMPRACRIVAAMSGGVIGRSVTPAPILSVAPITAAAPDAAAGHDDREGVGPVVAAGHRVDARRAAELRRQHHQRRVEQAALASDRRPGPTRPGPGSAPAGRAGCGVFSRCVSQWPFSMVTKRQPASTSRRASRQHWPRLVMP